MASKTYDVKGLSAWMIKLMYNKAQLSGHNIDAQALRKAFVKVYEDEKENYPVLAECCGCSCEKCSHQGGRNRHTPECIEIFFRHCRKFEVVV